MTNGEVDYDQDPDSMISQYPIGTNASFRCLSGYILEGPSSRTCQTSGNWNQQQPRCNRGKYSIVIIIYNL